MPSAIQNPTPMNQLRHSFGLDGGLGQLQAGAVQAGDSAMQMTVSSAETRGPTEVGVTW